MSGWTKRLKMMRISKYAIIICLLLSIVFAGFTVYGARTGNFVIFVQPNNDVDIAIYKQEDKSDIGTLLEAETMPMWTNTTYNVLSRTSGKFLPGLGDKNDANGTGTYNRYMCVSFMLVNRSDRPVDYLMELTVSDIDMGSGGGNPLDSIRVMLLKGNGPFTDGTVFAKAESSEDGIRMLTDPTFESVYDGETLTNERLWKKVNYTPYETQPFISDDLLFSKEFYELGSGAEEKFTIVAWLEGQDIDCVDEMFEGYIQLRMDIYGR